MSTTTAVPVPAPSEHALELWTDHLAEQASIVSSTTLALTSATATAWRETCAVVLTIEIAKLRALVIAAPAGAPIAVHAAAHREAAAALAEALAEAHFRTQS